MSNTDASGDCCGWRSSQRRVPAGDKACALMEDEPVEPPDRASCQGVSEAPIAGDDGGPHLQSVSSLLASPANIETRCFCISILSSAIEFFLDGLIRQLAHANRMQSQTDDRISIRV